MVLLLFRQGGDSLGNQLHDTFVFNNLSWCFSLFIQEFSLGISSHKYLKDIKPTSEYAPLSELELYP